MNSHHDIDLTDREWFAQLLYEHEQRFHSNEKKTSVPIRIESKWGTITGNWKGVVFIVVTLAVVAVTFILSRKL